ncbi:MAG: ATP-binding protein [Planctomycetota bacterium]
MNSSLRSQFLIPIVAMLLLICTAVTAVSWTIASRTSRTATETRLRNLLQLCAVSKFPLTEPVLDQIGEFSRCKIRVVSQVAVTDELFTSEELAGNFDSLAIRLDRNPMLIEGANANYLLALSDPQERFERTAQAFWLPMATGVLSTLAFCAIALGIANRMVKRLETLETQVNRIAAGEYQSVATVDTRRVDSIGSLARSINSMAQQLDKAKEEIANSERSRLINMMANGMAHQLRNSLAGAVLLLQTALKRNADGPAHEIQYALGQIQLAEESIRRLLTVSRHGQSANEQSLSVQEIHQQIDTYTRSMAEHHQIDLQVECSQADGARILSAGNSVISSLLNLVINAIEAASSRKSDSQGMVQCRYQWDSVNLLHRWLVRDNGSGPDPSISLKMFEPFVTSKPEGIGLGLPTTALLAKQLVGSLQWHRRGEWTEFELTIRDSSQQGKP